MYFLCVGFIEAPQLDFTIPPLLYFLREKLLLLFLETAFRFFLELFFGLPSLWWTSLPLTFTPSFSNLRLAALRLALSPLEPEDTSPLRLAVEYSCL